jgi:hypothetical protein
MMFVIRSNLLANQLEIAVWSVFYFISTAHGSQSPIFFLAPQALP